MRTGVAFTLLVATALASPPPEQQPRFQVHFFTAKWCGPCRAVYPVLEKYASKEPKCVAIVSVDFDEQRGVANQFGVSSVPVVIGADGKGQASFRIDGAGREELRSLDTALADYVRRCRARKEGREEER